MLPTHSLAETMDVGGAPRRETGGNTGIHNTAVVTAPIRAVSDEVGVAQMRCSGSTAGDKDAGAANGVPSGESIIVHRRAVTKPRTVLRVD